MKTVKTIKTNKSNLIARMKIKSANVKSAMNVEPLAPEKGNVLTFDQIRYMLLTVHCGPC